MPENTPDNALHPNSQQVPDHPGWTPDKQDNEGNLQKAAITTGEMQSIMEAALSRLVDRVNTLSSGVGELKELCKRNMDDVQRYQHNTVAVLLEQGRQKDRSLNRIILIDLIKPVAEICAKIERRIRKSSTLAEKEFLQELLEEIEETAVDEYDIVIRRTEAGQPRPEHISTIVKPHRETHDPSLNNTVAESLCASWTLDNRVIQKEKVVMYQYVPEPSSAVESREDDSNPINPDSPDPILPADQAPSAASEDSAQSKETTLPAGEEQCPVPSADAPDLQAAADAAHETPDEATDTLAQSAEISSPLEQMENTPDSETNMPI